MSRLGNVAGIVLCAPQDGPAEADARRALLERLVEQVDVVAVPGDGASSLASLEEALGRSRAERVLIVRAGCAPQPVLLLGLTAFPEDDWVVPEAEAFGCGIARRESVRAAARRCLAAGGSEVEDLVAELAVTRVTAADLTALGGAPR